MVHGQRAQVWFIVSLLVLVLYISGVVEGELFYFGSSIENGTASSLMLDGAQLAFDRFNREQQANPFNITLSVLPMYDRRNPNMTTQNVKYLINDSSVLGLMFSSSEESALATRQAINGTNMPYLRPTTGLREFSTPIQRNLILFDGSIEDELNSIAYWLVSVKGVIQVAFLYSNDLESYEAAAVAPRVFSQFSLQLSAILQINTTSPDNDTLLYLNTLAPSAIIFWTSQEIMFHWTAALFTPYSGNQMLLSPTTTLVLQTRALVRDTNVYDEELLEAVLRSPVIYRVSFRPRFQSVTPKMRNNFIQDAGITSNPLGDDAAWEGYLVGTFIANVVLRIQDKITRETFLDTLYQYSSVNIDGVYFGPISSCDDDEQTSIFPKPCCNSLSHNSFMSTRRINLQGQASYNSTMVYDQFLLRWTDTCHTVITNNLKPLSFGHLYDPNDPDVLGYVQGIRMYFLEANRRLNARPIQIISLPVDPNNATQVVQLTLYLIERAQVVALVGYTSALTSHIYKYTNEKGSFLPSSQGPFTPLIDPVSASITFRLNRPDFIHIRVGYTAQISCTLQRIVEWINTNDPRIDTSTEWINLALYHTLDQDGNDTLAVLEKAIDDLNTFYNATPGAPQNNIANQSMIIPTNRRFRLVFTITDQQLSQAPRLFAAVPVRLHYLFTSSREYNSEFVVANLSRLIVDTQDQNGLARQSDWATVDTHKVPFLRIVVVGSHRNIATELEVYNTTSIVDVMTAVYSPLQGIDSLSLYPAKLTLLQDYNNAIRTYNQSFTEAGEGGYVTGGFISQVIFGMGNGVVNSRTILEKINSGVRFLVSGIVFGPYKASLLAAPAPNATTSLYPDACTRGQHYSQLATRPRDNLDILHVYWTYFFPTCEPLLMVNVVNATITTPADLSTPSIILISVLSGICACFLVVLAILAMVLFVVLTRFKKKKDRLREPQWINYAVDPLFLGQQNRQKTSLNFVSSPGVPVSYGARRSLLNSLEQILLRPSTALFLIRCLTKSGVGRDKIVSAMLYVYEYNHKTYRFFKKAMSAEISAMKSCETLFREDSVFSSSWNVYSKLIGLPYLWRVLSQIIHSVKRVADDDEGSSESRGRSGSLDYSDAMSKRSSRGRGSRISYFDHVQSYEVDPKRVQEEESHFVNCIHLKLAAQATFNKIKSIPFPLELAKILTRLRTKISEAYPNQPGLNRDVVSNLLFLRFICTAISSPRSFGLSQHNPSTTNLRFLVILSKVIQNLGFGVLFEKEAYMVELNDFIEQNIRDMSNWVDNLSTLDDEEIEAYEKRGKEIRMLTRYDKGFEVSVDVKERSLKWLYVLMFNNRQLLRREEMKMRAMDRSEKGLYEALEELRIFKSGNMSEGSNSINTEREGKGSTEISGAASLKDDIMEMGSSEDYIGDE